MFILQAVAVAVRLLTAQVEAEQVEMAVVELVAFLAPAVKVPLRTQAAVVVQALLVAALVALEL
jgi:hypothetical protein